MLVAGGPLQAFPTIQAMFVDFKVYSSVCGKEATCEEQNVVLSNLFLISNAICLAIFGFLGYIFDRLGPNFAATSGLLDICCKD